MQLRQIKVFECLVRQAQVVCHAATTLRTDHTSEKPLARQTKHGFNPSGQRPRSVTPTFYKNKNFVQIGMHIKMHIKY
jgi:hypothetical protein